MDHFAQAAENLVASLDDDEEVGLQFCGLKSLFHKIHVVFLFLLLSAHGRNKFVWILSACHPFLKKEVGIGNHGAF